MKKTNKERQFFYRSCLTRQASPSFEPSGAKSPDLRVRSVLVVTCPLAVEKKKKNGKTARFHGVAWEPISASHETRARLL